jgi:squalene-hopene/tetraprenyl-beta-curcumene cyclase
MNKIAILCCASLLVKPLCADGESPREAAQKGLMFLAKEAPRWAASHKCYGCHVHAVTLEAFVVGRHHRYEVPDSAFQDILKGMLDGPGGARSEHGFNYDHGHNLQAPAKAFGGAALARYDQHMDNRVLDELMATARALLKYQDPKTGKMNAQWTNGPVGAGDTQTTFQAIQTWRQAYARSADPAWLPPLRLAETFLGSIAERFKDKPNTPIQELNYTLLGLAEAGAQRTERQLAALIGHLLERQLVDGGWSLGGSTSGAFATGQTVYTLRRLGLTEQDEAVRRGTDWLMEKQTNTGGWSSSGSSKAEAMWGVMGLVSIDVLSVELKGIQDGQRIEKEQAIQFSARDNKGKGVKRITLLLDDVELVRVKGGKGNWILHPGKIDSGIHLLDIVAENNAGLISIRRFRFYTGDIYLTELGSVFSEGETILSARNLATSTDSAKVSLTVYQQITDGKGVREEAVFSAEQASKQGALSFTWDGKNKAGTPADSGRYIARISYIDTQRGLLQKEEIVFSRMSSKQMKECFAEVNGKLDLEDKGAANTPVDLVDDQGRVVQRVWTTRDGNYRFQNVDAGKYKVRVRKKGFEQEEIAVDAVTGKETDTKINLQKKQP